jgi:hypothetical protein
VPSSLSSFRTWRAPKVEYASQGVLFFKHNPRQTVAQIRCESLLTQETRLFIQKSLAQPYGFRQTESFMKQNTPLIFDNRLLERFQSYFSVGTRTIRLSKPFPTASRRTKMHPKHALKPKPKKQPKTTFTAHCKTPVSSYGQTNAPIQKLDLSKLCTPASINHLVIS